MSQTRHNDHFEQYSSEVTCGENAVQVEVMSQKGSLGLGNPNGITIVGLLGFDESGRTWEHLSRILVASAAEDGLDLSVVRYTDSGSYSQTDHNHVAETVTRDVKHSVVDGHRVALVGHSRGGVTAAHIGASLVEDGIVDSVTTLASPVKGVPIAPIHLIHDVAHTSLHLTEPETLDVMRTFVGNLFHHIGLDAEAIKRTKCPVETLRRIGRCALATLHEVQEVSGSDIRQQLLDLSGMVNVVTLFSEFDGLVHGDTNIRHLGEYGFDVQRRSRLLSGQTHNSVMTNNSASAHIIANAVGTLGLAA